MDGTSGAQRLALLWVLHFDCPRCKMLSLPPWDCAQQGYLGLGRADSNSLPLRVGLTTYEKDGRLFFSFPGQCWLNFPDLLPCNAVAEPCTLHSGFRTEAFLGETVPQTHICMAPWHPPHHQTSSSVSKISPTAQSNLFMQLVAAGHSKVGLNSQPHPALNRP